MKSSCAVIIKEFSGCSAMWHGRCRGKSAKRTRLKSGKAATLDRGSIELARQRKRRTDQAISGAQGRSRSGASL
jgi:hypothetical protein